MLKDLIDQLIRDRRATVTLADVVALQERMVAEGASYSAQFGILDSDYSVDEALDGNRQGVRGKFLIALVARTSVSANDFWLDSDVILAELERHGVAQTAGMAMIKQLVDSTILLEEEKGHRLMLRIAIPLLRERYVKQNYYLRHLASVR